MQLETTLNERAAGATAATTATAVGGLAPREAGTGSAVDTRALGRHITFNGEDVKW